jgi:chromate transporter
MDPLEARTPPIGRLIGQFARIGVLAFGGGVTTHILSRFTRLGWLSESEFLDALSWCQNLPGPNATNLSAFLGWRFGGVAGALGSTLAIVTPGALIVVALGEGLALVPQQGLVRGGLAGVAAAAVGLLVGTIWNVAQGAKLTRLRAGACVVTALAVAFGVPTPIAMAVMIALLWPKTVEASDAGAA